MDGVTFEERLYPSAYDYEDAAKNGNMGAAVVSEIKGRSNLVFDAAVGTTSGYRFEYDREVEKKHTAHPAAFDEGWTAETDGRTETVSADTMRIIDSRKFDQLVRRGTSDSGNARRAMALTRMSESLINEKARNILYGGMPAADGTVNGKEIAGFVSYVSEITDLDAMKKRWEGGLVSPFTGEYGLTLDNQDGAEYQEGTSLTTQQSQNVWTSVFGIAWGPDGCFTTYPQYLEGLLGYNLKVHRDNPAFYEDKRDGKTKMAWDDIVTGEAAFGIGVKNRFCISGLRNIYLGHKNRKDMADEMYRVEQNLIEMYNFFRLGETGMTMNFYCSPFLLSKFEQFQKNRVVMVGTTPNQNDGSYGRINNGRLQVADGITLVSDFAFKTTESYISEEVDE